MHLKINVMSQHFIADYETSHIPQVDEIVVVSFLYRKDLVGEMIYVRDAFHVFYS